MILSTKMDCLSKNKVKNDTSNRINVYSNFMSNGRNNFNAIKLPSYFLYSICLCPVAKQFLDTILNIHAFNIATAHKQQSLANE